MGEKQIIGESHLLSINRAAKQIFGGGFESLIKVKFENSLKESYKHGSLVYLQIVSLNRNLDLTTKISSKQGPKKSSSLGFNALLVVGWWVVGVGWWVVGDTALPSQQ